MIYISSLTLSSMWYVLVVNTKLKQSAIVTIGAASSASLQAVCNSKQYWHLSSLLRKVH
jgi:hypothetical protein